MIIKFAQFGSDMSAMRQFNKSISCSLIICPSFFRGHRLLAAKLGTKVIISPHSDWTMWPGNILLSCILLLVPRRIWPFVMAVALLVFGVYDLRLGLSLRTVFQLPNAIETLTPHLVSGMLLVRSCDWVRRRRRSRSLHHVSLYEDSTDWPRYI